MKKISTLVLALAISVVTFAQTTWSVDPSHSSVNFSVSHLVISEVDGTFKTFNGSLATATDDFSNAEISFEIDVNSVDTQDEKRDGHLIAEDFFFAEKYPKITFKSTSFKKGENGKYLLKGNLTMRGVTETITLDVKYGGTAKGPYGFTRVGFKITGSLDRIAYGVAYNGKTETGALMIGEDIDLVIKLEFIKQ